MGISWTTHCASSESERVNVVLNLLVQESFVPSDLVLFEELVKPSV